MKNTVGHFIKEGDYEFCLRIHCIKPKIHYKTYYFRKSEGWTLEKVRAERNMLCKQFEEDGTRASGNPRRGGRIPWQNLTLMN